MTRNLTLILAFCLAIWTTASAQNVAPVVTTPIAAFTEYAGAPARSIDLAAVFSDPDASNAVQMSVLLPSSTGFFNIALDGQHKPITLATSNCGCTVFGHVTGVCMTIVNSIAAVPIFNLGSPFNSLPLRNYTSGFIRVTNLVSIAGITVISPLAFTASSDNPAVATATISGKNLLVTPLQPGTAHIMAKATDLDGANVSQTFTVTVMTLRSVSWSVAGVADFNRDGHPDYLLYNGSTRQTAIWYLNNNVLSSGLY